MFRPVAASNPWLSTRGQDLSLIHIYGTKTSVCEARIGEINSAIHTRRLRRAPIVVVYEDEWHNSEICRRTDTTVSGEDRRRAHLLGSRQSAAAHDGNAFRCRTPSCDIGHVLGCSIAPSRNCLKLTTTLQDYR